MKCSKCFSDNPDDSLFCSSCGSHLNSAASSPDSGETLLAPLKEMTRGLTIAGRYTVVEELGRGGMGKVYRVIDSNVDEEIALKILNPEVATDESTITRFRNELKIARKISHRHVCSMYDIQEQDGIHFITMEFVPGEDLKTLIKRIGQFSMGKAVSIARQVLEGLAEAHRGGIIHRDLKPQNIMIDREGNARIMDFGIARFLKKKGITQAGIIIGTPEYMSPEQVEGKEVDQRSDIYSLGIIMYEMLTGRLPFSGDTPFSIGFKQKSELPQNPRDINAQIPEEINDIVLKCLEKDKTKRFQSAENMLKALDEVEHILPTTQKTAHTSRKNLGSREITIQFNIRKILFPLIFVLAAAALFYVGWHLIFPQAGNTVASERPTLAVLYFENNTGDDSLDHWRKGFSDLLIADLSQSKFISVLSSESLYDVLEKSNLLEAETYSGDDLKTVGARGRVMYVLVGKIHKAGETIRINTTLQEARSGKILGSESVEGQGEDSFFELVDTLTRNIKSSLQLTAEEIAADIDEEVQRITTSSPEALRYFREGQKFLNTGDYQKSIPLLETAVGIDPEFAMAYRTLSSAYGSLGHGADAQSKMKTAFELTDKVSDRERYIIQGQYYAQSEENYEQAIQAYSRLLQIYPEDPLGNMNLGILYLSLEDWDKAIEKISENERRKDVDVENYLGLASAYLAKGMERRATAVLQKYLDEIGENAIIRHRLADIALLGGDFDGASHQAGRMFALEPTHYRNWLLRGDIHFYQGRFDSAAEEYLKLLEQGEPAAHNVGLRRLCALNLVQGKKGESLLYAEQGVELAELLGELRWRAWFNLSLSYLHLKFGDLDQAETAIESSLAASHEAGSLKDMVVAHNLKGQIAFTRGNQLGIEREAEEVDRIVRTALNKKLFRFSAHLRSLAAIRKGDSSAALTQAEAALKLLSDQNFVQDQQGMFYYLKGEALLAGEQWKAAADAFRTVTQLTVGRLCFGDIYARSFFNLGRIGRIQGDRELSDASYQSFLSLMEHADPVLPEINEARTNLNDSPVR